MQSINPAIDIRHQPADLRRTLVGKALIAVGASLFVAVCAHISIPLGFTPVPLTLQTFAVLCVGLVLGPQLGFAALALYLAEGASGLPVFSPHGLGGVAQLLGPTGGYLFSYPIAAAAAGFAMKSVRNRQWQFPAALLGGVIATALVLSIGAAWMAHLLHLAPAAAWHLAVAPFLPGEGLKIAAAAGVCTTLRRQPRS
jgi:biotin transport system substrate-specific component